MRFSESLQRLALLATLPVLTVAGPVPMEGDKIIHGLTYRKKTLPHQDGVCGNVPKWINDAAAYEKLVGEPVRADELGPGSARTCLDLAWELEYDATKEWDNIRTVDNKELVRKGRCNFNISPFQDNAWTVIVQGQDVADIIRDAVKKWCPNSWHLESGVMTGNDDASGDCPLLGHGIVDDCLQRAHGNGRSSLLWYIGAQADDWTDDGQYNAPDYGGWSGGPIR